MTKTEQLLWRVSKTGGGTTVIFEGAVDEFSTFPASSSLSGKVTFDLAGILRLNSIGIRHWIDFIESLTDVSELIFNRCSVQFINQLNMVEELHGRAEIRSFYVPYYCRETGEKKELLMTVQSLQDPLNPPTFPCAGGTMELADVPEQYFAFLLDE